MNNELKIKQLKTDKEAIEMTIKTIREICVYSATSEMDKEASLKMWGLELSKINKDIKDIKDMEEF